MDELHSFIESHGFKFEPQELDGRYHEIRCEITDKKLWYVGEKDLNDKIALTFGAFGTEDKFHFKDLDKKKLSKAEKKLKDQERLGRWEELSRAAMQKYKEVWPKDTPVLNENYLDTKGLWNFPKPVKLDCEWTADNFKNARLMLPMRDTLGKLWNIQFLSTKGFKSNISKGRTQGLFNLIGETTKRLYVCEGFSTAMTVHLATGAQSLCAFGLTNISHVLNELRLSKNSQEIVVVIDNDHEKQKNAGHDMIKKLEKKFGTCKYVSPKNVEKGESDYNDVMKRLGLSGVAKDIEEQLGDMSLNPIVEPGIIEPETILSRTAFHIEKYVNGVAPMPSRYNDKGVEIMPNESEVAEHVMDYYRGRIIASEEAFFLYKKTHWVEMADHEFSELTCQFMVAHNGKSGIRRYDACMKLFLKLVPRAPRNMFVANPYLINLLNGTLHVTLGQGEWGFEFLPHNKMDFVTNVIPIDFKTGERNTDFEEMVGRLLGGDADKIRAVRQMYGACLAPIFPRLFMLYGHPGSGKSSLIIGAKKLAHDTNVSQVQPCDMEGFHLESLIGKLINLVTDVDLTKPMKDAIIKQIEDRIPISINRKFKSVVSAPIPAVHIFGGNDIPVTFERGSGAHNRRWTFIKVDTFKAENDNYSRNFAAETFDKNPAGVLNFALEGLRDLLTTKGLFYAPQSSKDAIEEWQTQNDVVSCFIKEIKDGEVQELDWNPEMWAIRPDLWRLFCKWHLEYYNRASKLPKGKFFSALVVKHGGKTRRVDGNFEISGFEIKNSEKIKAEFEAREKAKNDEKTEIGGKINTTKGQMRFNDAPY